MAPRSRRPAIELEYELSSEDYAAFNVHFARTSPAVSRQQGRTRWTLSLSTVVVVFVLIGLVFRDPIPGVVLAAITAVGLWLLFPRLWAREINKNVRRMAQGDALGAPGHHRLTLDDEGIREETAGTVTTAAWSRVSRIEEDGEYVFVFFGPTQAFVLPKRAGAAQVGAFVSEIRRHCPDR